MSSANSKEGADDGRDHHRSSSTANDHDVVANESFREEDVPLNEIQATMKNNESLTGKDHQKKLDQVKEKHDAPPTNSSDDKPCQNKLSNSYDQNIVKQRRLELGLVMKDRRLDRGEKRRKMAEIQSKYAALATAESTNSPEVQSFNTSIDIGSEPVGDDEGLQLPPAIEVGGSKIHGLELVDGGIGLPPPPNAFAHITEERKLKHHAKERVELITDNEGLPHPSALYEEDSAAKQKSKVGGLEVVHDNAGPPLPPMFFTDSIEKRKLKHYTKKGLELITDNAGLPQPHTSYGEDAATKLKSRPSTHGHSPLPPSGVVDSQAGTNLRPRALEVPIGNQPRNAPLSMREKIRRNVRLLTGGTATADNPSPQHTQGQHPEQLDISSEVDSLDTSSEIDRENREAGHQGEQNHKGELTSESRRTRNTRTRMAIATLVVCIVGASIAGVLLSRDNKDEGEGPPYGDFDSGNMISNDSRLNFCLPAAKYDVCMNATCFDGPDCECNAYAKDTLDGAPIDSCTFCDITGNYQWKIDCTNLAGNEVFEASGKDNKSMVSVTKARTTLPSARPSVSPMPSSSSVPTMWPSYSHSPSRFKLTYVGGVFLLFEVDCSPDKELPTSDILAVEASLRASTEDFYRYVLNVNVEVIDIFCHVANPAKNWNRRLPSGSSRLDISAVITAYFHPPRRPGEDPREGWPLDIGRVTEDSFRGDPVGFVKDLQSRAGAASLLQQANPYGLRVMSVYVDPNKTYTRFTIPPSRMPTSSPTITIQEDSHIFVILIVVIPVLCCAIIAFSLFWRGLYIAQQQQSEG